MPNKKSWLLERRFKSGRIYIKGKNKKWMITSFTSMIKDHIEKASFYDIFQFIEFSKTLFILIVVEV